MTQFGLTMLHACGRCGHDKTEGIEGIGDDYFNFITHEFFKVVFTFGL